MTHLRKLWKSARTGLVAAGLLAVASGVSAQERAMDTKQDMAYEGTDLVQTLRQADLTAYADLVEAAGLEDDLAREDALTIFVPTNAAFAAVPEGVVKGPDASRRAVQHVALKGTLDMAGEWESVSLQPFETVGGVSVERAEDGSIRIRDSDQTAGLVGDPIEAGPHIIIYPIDTALLPERDSMNEPSR